MQHSLKIENRKLKIALVCFAFFLASMLYCLTSVTVHAGVISMPPNNLGLVGYWSFNEGTGTVAGDHSGNGNDGSFVGTPTWIDGKRGKAIEFNGLSRIDTGSPVLPNQVEASGSFWFKTTSNDIRHFGGQHPGTSVLGRNVFRMSGGKLTWQISGSNLAETSGVYNDGEWHHAVFVRSSGGEISIYVDGQLDGTGNNGNAFDQSNFLIAETGTVFTSNRWIGVLDEVRIYNRALSESEIQKLHQSGSARIGASTAGQLADGLAGHWTFDGQDISGTTVYDKSGQGNDGTITADVTPTSGKLGQGLDFAGTGSNVFSFPSISFSGSATWAAWVKADDLSSDGAFRTVMGSSGGNRIFISANPGQLSIRESATNHALSGSLIELDEWTHIAVVWDGQNATGYINGIEKLTKSIGSSVSDYNRIGGIVASGRWDGAIDDVRIYNRVLSVEEVNQLYRLGQTTVAKTSQTGVQQSNLVAHWTFDGPTISGTTVLDVSGNGNDGTMIGDTKPAYGKIGQALEFDGSGDYVRKLTPNGLFTPEATWSAWVKGLNDAFGYILFIGQSGDRFAVYKASSGRVGFYDDIDGDAQATIVGPNGTLTLNEWAHVVTVINSNGTKDLYVNGEYIGSDNDGSNLSNISGGNVHIGAQVSGNNGVNAVIDDVRIYNTVLSVQEIKQLYQMGR